MASHILCKHNLITPALGCSVDLLRGCYIQEQGLLASSFLPSVLTTNLHFFSMKLNAGSSLVGTPAPEFLEDPRALNLNGFIIEYISAWYRPSEK